MLFLIIDCKNHRDVCRNLLHISVVDTRETTIWCYTCCRKGGTAPHKIH